MSENKFSVFLRYNWENRRHLGWEERGMQKIKLIALDLDGTTLDENSRLSERTKKTLERAAEAGIYLCDHIEWGGRLRSGKEGEKFCVSDEPV